MKPTTFACLAALGLGGAAVMATPAAAQSWDYHWGAPPSAGVMIEEPS